MTSRCFLIFGAGGALGVGATCAMKSRRGRNLAVALASKGLELKDRLTCMADRMKESVEDIVAEARYAHEHGDAGEAADGLLSAHFFMSSCVGFEQRRIEEI